MNDCVLEAIEAKSKKLKLDETTSQRNKITVQILGAMKLTDAHYKRMIQNMEAMVIDCNDDVENVMFTINIKSLLPFSYTSVTQDLILAEELEGYTKKVFEDGIHRISIHLAELWNEQHSLIPVLLLKQNDTTLLSSFKTK